MTKDIQFSYAKAVSAEAVAQYQQAVANAQEQLVNGTGLGNDFLGWMNLPTDIRPQLADIQATAELLRRECEVIVCIGIGGSYLGAKAVIDALTNSFAWLEGNKPAIVYAGQNIGEDYLYELQTLLKNKKFGIISISKSGTTTEPALAFRLLKTQLEEQQGKQAANRLHYRCQEGRTPHVGYPRGLQDLCHRGQYRRSFLCALACGLVAYRMRGFGYQRPD